MSLERPTTGDPRLDKLMQTMAKSPSLIINEVLKDGGGFTAFNNYQYIVKHEGEFYSFHDTRCSNSYGCMNLAEIKSYARAILASQNVSIPKGGVFSDTQKALTFFNQLGGAVVVKPVDGIFSKNVTTGITSEEAFVAAVDLSSSQGRKAFIVEQEIVGTEYRVLVLNGEVIAVLRKDPPYVIGDGKRDIETLIDEKNKCLSQHPLSYNRLINKDDNVTEFLSKQGFDFKTVPAKGELIKLCSPEKYMAGGIYVEAGEELSDEAKRQAVRAVLSIEGMSLSGVDVIVEQHSGKPYVIECNENPGIAGHVFPYQGASINVAKMIWESVKQNRQRHRETIKKADGSISR
ncbi:hypothetical protein ACU6TU_05540 [Halomonas sp. LS-001]